MTKLLSAIIGGALGLTLAASIGVGVAVGSNSPINEARAADSVYAQATFNATNNQTSVGSYTNSWSNVTNNFTWNLTNFNNNNNTWEYVKCGYKSAASTATIETASAVSPKITKVDITIDAITSKKVTSITLYGGANGTTSLGTFTKGTGTQTVTIASNKQAANQKYKISFVCQKGSSNGLVTVSSVKLYSDASSPTLTISNPDVELGANNSDGVKVGATTTNITTPTYSWTTTSQNISLTNANTSEVTIKPVNNVNENATVTLTVGGTTPNLTATVNVVLFKQPYTVAEARAAIDAGKCITGVYTSGIIAQVDSYNSQYKSIQYWISDDGSTTNMLEVYSGKGLNGADFAAVTDIEVGAIVTIKGNLKKYNSTYEYDVSSQQTSYLVKTITGLTMTGSMTKTLYSDGSQWNPAGIEVIASYNDNTTGDVTGGVTWSYNPATPTLGVTSVVVTASFGGFSVSSSAIAVTVSTTPYTNGIPYKMYLLNTNLNKTLYFTGAMGTGQQQYYGASTETKSEAVDVYFENNATSGQNIYFNSGNSKNYFYVSTSVVDNKTHYNFAFSTSLPSQGWGYNGNCIIYEVDGVDYTYGTYDNFTTFGATNASFSNNFLVDFEVSDSVTADTFASEFLSKLTCDATGESAPTFATGYTWADFQVLFSQLPSTEQETLRTAVANESGTSVQQAMARYDYIVAKYSYNNFINRSVASLSHKMNNFLGGNSAVMITVVIGLITTPLMAAWFMLKKRKLD